MKSSINRPTSLSAKAVQTAVFKPKHRRNPRATLYSPPPSHTLNSRAVRTRPSPGSKRSMISPNETRSYLHEPAGLILRIDISRNHFVAALFGSGSDSVTYGSQSDNPILPACATYLYPALAVKVIGKFFLLQVSCRAVAKLPYPSTVVP